MVTELSRFYRHGSSKTVLIPKKIWDFLSWRDTDRVVITATPNRLTMERLPLEDFARRSVRVAEETP